MLLGKDTVGNSKVSIEDVFEVVEVNLFPKSLMSTTIQDDGTRERRDDNVTLILTLDLKIKNK